MRGAEMAKKALKDRTVREGNEGKLKRQRGWSPRRAANFPCRAPLCKLLNPTNFVKKFHEALHERLPAQSKPFLELMLGASRGRKTLVACMDLATTVPDRVE